MTFCHEALGNSAQWRAYDQHGMDRAVDAAKGVGKELDGMKQRGLLNSNRDMMRNASTDEA
jgi:hypothetical protein